MNNCKLEWLREELDLLVKDVAKDLGVVESVYSEWENGKLSIPTRRLNQIANYYSVNIDYMLGFSKTKIRIKSSDEIDIKIVSARLKEIRKELNLTMRALAEILNTTSSAISNYEKEKYLILSPFLIELCKRYNYSIDWILGRSNKKFIKD